MSTFSSGLMPSIHILKAADGQRTLRLPANSPCLMGKQGLSGGLTGAV